MFLVEMRAEAGTLARVAPTQGWRVAGGQTDDVPDLIVVADIAEVVAIRGGEPRRAAAPIALLAPQPGAPPRDIDDMVAPLAGEAEARAILDRWRPDPPETLDRIEAVFGVVTVRDLLLRLQAQLRTALDDDARGDVVRRAHRLAGIAGMLGFAALGEAWLAIERGAPGADRAARIETRRALAAIARRVT